MLDAKRRPCPCLRLGISPSIPLILNRLCLRSVIRPARHPVLPWTRAFGPIPIGLKETRSSSRTARSTPIWGILMAGESAEPDDRERRADEVADAYLKGSN